MSRPFVTTGVFTIPNSVVVYETNDVV
jgi:hypothetical protein